jgi:hypothetical protein
LARETEAFRSRLPKILAPFASNLKITSPTEKVSIQKSGGANHSYCAVDRRTVVISASLPNNSSNSSEGETNDSDAKSVEKEITVTV